MTRPKIAFVAMCIAVVTGVVAIPVSAQSPLPPPPAEAEPVVAAASVLMFQACLAQTSMTGLVQTGTTVVPVGIPVSLSPVIDTARNLLLLGTACEYFAPRIVPPTCTVDANVPAAPVSVPQPAAIVAAEALALDRALDAYGAPTSGQLSGPAYEQLGCSGS